MDRLSRAGAVSAWGFPRMCGDGPLSIARVIRMMGFPPHVRGWTLSADVSSGGNHVSPACAGMDRMLNDATISTTGFPRMCGDGPAGSCLSSVGCLFPPHVRGWTVRAEYAKFRDHVSPACAGMDPYVSGFEVMYEGFPRMCGDGPLALTGRSLSKRFPPHVRGWTGGREDGSLGFDVSPACAGMDR